MKLLGSLFLSLLLTSIIMSSCDSETNAKNYFAEAGLQLPASSNDAVNQLMAEFLKLYNELSAAVDKGTRMHVPGLPMPMPTGLCN